jgi:hypothetical protein
MSTKQTVTFGPVKSFTWFPGKMSKRTVRRIRSIATQLKMSEAEAIEWAVNRCGLRISIPSKFFPEF